MTEYSSIKFLLYMLSEYVAMVSMSAAIVTLFLGGWRAPWPITLWSGANEAWWPLIWFVAKIVILLFVFVWARATLPRLRYDQFMRLGWKVLLPINLAWILLLAGVRVLQNGDISRGYGRYGLIVGLAVIAIVVVMLLLSGSSPEPARTAKQMLADRPTGSFPLPPLDLQVPPSPRAKRGVAERQPANVGATIEGEATPDEKDV
jgi:NADH-quinone oxidoreductase subunit H